jgi:glutamyl endopeptidase
MPRVNNAQVPPRPAVGLLAMRWSTNQWAWGSGALIDAQNILTCSHNMVDQVNSGPAPGYTTQVLFYPGHDTPIPHPNNPPVGGLPVACGIFSQDYYNGHDDWDVGIFRLAAPANVNAQNFFRPTVTGNQIVDTPITLTGYPGNHLGEMWEDLDEANALNIERNTLLYTHDTFGGSSGSPVWTYDADNDVVLEHAIHVAQPWNNLRRGILITTNVMNWITNALQVATPPGFALLPL